ncbi:DUF4192 domain-containing protein [Streptomyces sp. NPDC048659]|uniref:DUF4192 domain-containing protein n=1 Tax=Streptomyces sp. NPDC048659 TaxID=3155489 RepID=UPI0034367C7F
MNTNHHASHGPSTPPQITLRGPAELADALPFMLGFHPSDSVVLVALHGERGRFGGRVRLGIPRSPHEWAETADHLAECLVEGSTRHGDRPDAIVVFLCQDPAPGETGRHVMERLRPLSQRLRTACGALDVPVLEALCVSDGLYFSYCCASAHCCPPDGTPLALSGTTVMAASAAYAGIQVRGSLKEMKARLRPRPADDDTSRPSAQRAALGEAAFELVPKILDAPAGHGRTEIRATTIRLAHTLITRLAEPAAPDSGTDRPHDVLTGRAGLTAGRGHLSADAADDARITEEEAAALILGLQDRDTRDQAAEWMEGPEADVALRLWRALSRRCVAPYQEYAAAPLALAGWVAWSSGDEPSARVAISMALEADPEYVFARLMHQACNEGLDPESLRSCLRKERADREAAERKPDGDDGPGREPCPGTGPRDRRRVADRPAGPRSSAAAPRAARRGGAGRAPGAGGAARRGATAPRTVVLRRTGRRGTRSGG